MAGLAGRYIYADFLSGQVWAFDPDPEADPVNEELDTIEANISAFGVDEEGEIYLCGFDGKIYRFSQEVIIEELLE